MHLETDTIDSIRALNVGANVVNARMTVVENDTAVFERIVLGVAVTLNSTIDTARDLAAVVSSL